MNRHERRAAAAQARQAPDRAEVIRHACDYLANIAAPTATGCTIFLTDGETVYLSAADARAMAGTAPARGRA